MPFRTALRSAVPFTVAMLLAGQRAVPTVRMPETGMVGRLVTRAWPAIPQQVREQGVSGTVVLHVLVAPDGHVESVIAVSGPEILRAPYVEAVKQWVYEPTPFHGQAVRVDTTVTLILNKGEDRPFEPQPAGAPGNGMYGPGALLQDTRRRMRVSSGVMAEQAVTRPSPVYPAEARKRHIYGSIVMHVVVGRDGKVLEVTPISGPEILRKPYCDAVRQWEFRPFLLNGEAAEVESTVTLSRDMGAG